MKDERLKTKQTKNNKINSYFYFIINILTYK